MTELSTWAKLDTWRMMKEIEAAHGSAVFTKDAMLDPHLMVRQINSALGTSLGVQDVLDMCGRGALDINTGLVGGGVPDWVPANAKIFIDLVNNRAWTEADGIVAVDTLLGSDPNTVNAWQTSEYDPSLLDEDGLAHDDATGLIPALIGAARTKLLTGATIVERLRGTGVNSGALFVAAADGNDAVYTDASGRAVSVKSYNGPVSISIENCTNFLEDNSAENCLAVTITGNRVDLAVNGFDVVTSALDDTDRPSANPFVACGMDFGAGNHLRSITIYDPLPDTTGLSALSQTGVTNTAPTFGDPTWGGNAISPGVFSSADFSGGLSILQVLAADAEGNPVTYTMTNDGGGMFAIDGVNTDGPLVVSSAITPSPGTYSFTLRATDPGGLYVEQPFTITVTA